MPSKKTKSQQRKIDISEVEEALAKKREEDRITGGSAIEQKKSNELFFVDKGPQDQTPKNSGTST